MIPAAPVAPTPPPRPLIRWGLGDVLIALLLWLMGGIVVSLVLIATGTVEASATDLGLGALAISLVAGWPGFLGWPIIATRWKGQRSLARDFGLTIQPIDLAWGLLGGVGALFVSFVGGVLWNVFSGSATPSNSDFLPSKPSVFTALVVFFLVAICTPIVEELFFRGLFLRSLGRRWNLTVGVIVSSLVFGLFHAQGSSWAQAAFIVLVTAGYGAVFALIVIRADGRLGPSIIAHMIVNSVGVAAAFLL
jgi:membrane protease YdiL (CAAX protease family)